MLTIDVAWDRPNRLLRADDPAVLRVRAIPTVGGQTLPLHCAIALDVSSSMNEDRKIDHARRACMEVAKALRPEDRLWLASYASEVTELARDVSGGPQGVHAVEQAVKSVRAEGTTRMDLALKWLCSSAGQIQGAASVAVLITDGRPTDIKGTELKDLSMLLTEADGIVARKQQLFCVGLGPASQFKPELLQELADRGRGGFLYAEDPSSLQKQLGDRLSKSQATGLSGVWLDFHSQVKGVEIQSVCRYHPDFVMIDLNSTGKVSLGNLQAAEPTDYLIEFRIPAGDFATQAGSRQIGRLEVGAEGMSAIEQPIPMNFVTSYRDSQVLDVEIDRARLLRDVKVHKRELVGTRDTHRTVALLDLIEEKSTRAGDTSSAADAQEMRKELESKGAVSPERKTQTLTS